jgi:hypothetical protein
MGVRFSDNTTQSPIEEGHEVIAKTVNTKCMTIRCDRHALRYAVPSPVWRQSEFRWKPEDLKGLTADQQFQSLGMWNRNSQTAQTFVVTSHDVLKAEYFAAMLVEMHMRQNRHSNVLWLPIYDDKLDRYTAQFRDAVPRAKREIEPTLIVLSNLQLESTNVQVEKARDVMARWPSIPTVIVGTSKHIDPITFAHYMLMPMHRAVHINPYRELIDV